MRKLPTWYTVWLRPTFVCPRLAEPAARLVLTAVCLPRARPEVNGMLGGGRGADLA